MAQSTNLKVRFDGENYKFIHKVDLSHGFNLVKKWKYMPLNPKCEKKITIRLVKTVPSKVFGKH